VVPSAAVPGVAFSHAMARCAGRLGLPIWPSRHLVSHGLGQQGMPVTHGSPASRLKQWQPMLLQSHPSVEQVASTPTLPPGFESHQVRYTIRHPPPAMAVLLHSVRLPGPRGPSAPHVSPPPCPPGTGAVDPVQARMTKGASANSASSEASARAGVRVQKVHRILSSILAPGRRGVACA
jgi:hypothetical protein